MSKYSNLSLEEQEQLQQYVASLKEIKKEIFDLVKKSKSPKVPQMEGKKKNKTLK